MDEDPAPAFARAPALAIEGLLDYTRSEHIKIYRSRIKQVSDTLFDCKAEGLYYQFLKDVQDRADKMGWTEEPYLDNYGTLTLKQVTEAELQYIDEGGQPAQDTYMLYKCLVPSLANKARKKVSLWSSQYRIGQENETGTSLKYDMAKTGYKVSCCKSF
jgi:hypothetical protein